MIGLLFSILDMWDKNKLTQAVLISTNYAEVVRNLGIAVSGSSHKLIKRNVIKLGLDTSHFKKAMTSRIRTKPDDILIENNTHTGSSTLRRIVLRENLIPYVCSECGVADSYNNKSITLQLDHQNGNRADCRLQNLRWLCPNCHSQTPTWGRAKSMTTGPRKKLAPRIEMVCDHCNLKFMRSKARYEYWMQSGAKHAFCTKKCRVAFGHKESRKKGGSHGTLAGYFVCPKPRCRPCLDAMMEYKRERRQKRSGSSAGRAAD